MSAGPLTSNHVNYLIWRYLQESGHGHTAARLQRDWGVDPQTLPFARHIGTHALISLVQKGLQYHEIEKSLDQYGNRKSPSPSMLYFGPESAQRLPTPNGNLDEDEAKSESNSSPQPRQGKVSRKNPRENGISYEFEGRAVKRSRRSNGNTATNGNLAQGSDNMDIDQNGYAAVGAATNTHGEATGRRDMAAAGSDSPPPSAVSGTGAVGGSTGTAGAGGMSTSTSMDVDAAEAEVHLQDANADDDALQVQPTASRPPTLTNGCSVGVQSDKVAELGPGTTVLRVPDKNVTHATWNPRDPSVLATGGATLCRLWSLAYAQPSPDPASTKQYTHVDLFDPMDTSFVTSMAWSPDGEYLAIARYTPAPTASGAISIRTKTGTIVDELPGGQDMVLNLSWNALGTLILGVAHSTEAASTLVVWDAKSGQALQPFELHTSVLDAAWTDDRSFIVCGAGIIGTSHILDRTIDALKTQHSDSGAPYEWSKLRFDPITRTVAVAAESSGDLAIIDAAATFRTIKAHDTDITALVYQPLSSPSAHADASPRLLATSSTHGSIKIWDATRPFTMVQHLTLGRSSPALAVSFTPDGYLVAAASWNKVLFWHAEGGGMPKATWKGKGGEWQSVSASAVEGQKRLNGEGEGEEDGDGDGDAEPVHSLSWDADGGKLAYGLNDQIAIINFRR
ncbi:hypothetical protein MMC30_001139 [Trapelia coarctata]|nr:hypothetical protein [Trapelia coarctata]